MPPRPGGYQGEGAKQENIVLKAYYSHISFSQGYFLDKMFLKSELRRRTQLQGGGTGRYRRLCGILEGREESAVSRD